MRTTLHLSVARAAALCCALSPALCTAALAEEGMWLPNAIPAAELKSKYGFEASPAALEHLQKSAVRFSTGGSGSIVSPDGLVMTNHHVGSDMLAKLSTPERDLLKTGFLAKDRGEELRCPDLDSRLLLAPLHTCLTPASHLLYTCSPQYLSAFHGEAMRGGREAEAFTPGLYLVYT